MKLLTRTKTFECESYLDEVPNVFHAVLSNADSEHALYVFSNPEETEDIKIMHGDALMHFKGFTKLGLFSQRGEYIDIGLQKE